jgi:hypothetical protein
MLTNDCISCLSYTRVNKESLVASRFSEGGSVQIFSHFRSSLTWLFGCWVEVFAVARIARAT